MRLRYSPMANFMLLELRSHMSKTLIPILSSAQLHVNSPASSPDAVRFGRNSGFLLTLRERVDESFLENGLRRRDLPAMYLKTFWILSWFAASYLLLIFAAATWWQAALLIVSLGFSMSAIGFNIQHDGAHGAYSDRRWVNNLMAMTLDMLGGSSYVWKRTHNQIHHSYTNITGHDEDIDLGIFGRLSPHQPRYWFHRAQHLYLWLLYGFLTFKWQWWSDLIFIAEHSVGGSRHSRPGGRDLLLFGGGKLLFAMWAIAVPMLFHDWYVVLGAVFAVSFVQGVLLSVVFQLAHCVEEAEFPMPSVDANRIENEWAIHQVQTTVNFARHSRLINWFTGGLNYQIEHHLFPQICHLHYPQLSRIVEQTSAEFGVRYSAHKTLSAAIGSHYRWLRRLGRPHQQAA